MTDYTQAAIKLQHLAEELCAQVARENAGLAMNIKEPAELLALAWYTQVSIDLETKLKGCSEDVQLEVKAGKLLAAHYHGDQINDITMYAPGVLAMVHTMTLIGKQVVSLGYGISGALPLWAHYVRVVRDLGAEGKLKIIPK